MKILKICIATTIISILLMATAIILRTISAILLNEFNNTFYLAVILDLAVIIIDVNLIKYYFEQYKGEKENENRHN